MSRLLAAVDVQRHVRGWLARRRVQRLWESEMLEWANRAATIVQRYVRGSQVGVWCSMLTPTPRTCERSLSRGLTPGVHTPLDRPSASAAGW